MDTGSEYHAFSNTMVRLKLFIKEYEMKENVPPLKKTSSESYKKSKAQTHDVEKMVRSLIILLLSDSVLNWHCISFTIRSQQI